jgi:hypothetical protein
MFGVKIIPKHQHYNLTDAEYYLTDYNTLLEANDIYIQNIKEHFPNNQNLIKFIQIKQESSPSKKKRKIDFN